MGRLKNAWRKVLMALVIGVLMGTASPARAQYTDGPAFVQRISHLTITLGQWASALKTATDQYMMVKAAAVGISDWRNFGWTSAFDLVNMPMFDGVSGIDDIRQLADATSMMGTELGTLFNQIETTQTMMNNPRFAKDAWYRAKVMGLNSMSARARATKVALIKQMRNDVSMVQSYLQQIKNMQTTITIMQNSGNPDSKMIASLQARIQALQVQVASQGIIGTNQKAIMLIGGAEQEKQFWERQFSGMSYSNNSQMLLRLGSAIGGVK